MSSISGLISDPDPFNFVMHQDFQSRQHFLLNHKLKLVKLIRYTAILLLCGFIGACGTRENTTETTNASAEVKADTPNVVIETKVDTTAKSDNPLIGTWKRTDGDYTIQVKSTAMDGTVDAAYFNPNPIHVGRSKWMEKGGVNHLMVELRDVNYPGSKYRLMYLPDGDRLTGTYFQAVEGKSYNVDFSRQK